MDFSRGVVKIRGKEAKKGISKKRRKKAKMI
jgi:hypothetical protein